MGRISQDSGGGFPDNVDAVGDTGSGSDASADGTVVASGGEDGIVRIYEGATAKLVKAAVPPEKK